MKTQSSFKTRPSFAKTMMIVFSIIGICGIVLSVLHLGSIDYSVCGAIVFLAVSYCVYLRSLESEWKHAAELDELFNSTLSTLALAIDAKDKNTHGHILRVQRYSRAMAEAMRLPSEQVTAIAASALLHDIGKLAIPEYILSKTGPLTPEEMRKMRLHPQLGADIISNIKFPYPVADSILSHHERFDGKGYPHGLKGKAIPLGARILAVADFFDAYNSEHSASPNAVEESMDLILQGAGTFFDPEIIAVWSAIYRDADKPIDGTAHSTAYSDIQRATSEIKILESLAESIAGFTTVEEISSAVCSFLKTSIPDCAVAITPDVHEGVPIIAAGATIAAISIHRSTGALTDDEIRLVHVIAEKISGSLHKAMALESARRDATVDKLTGLPNRRAFEMMSESMKDSKITIVLADVNSFKAVNDNFGHQAGDTALINIGAHLRAAFCGASLVCRLGGDEFLILSPAEARIVRHQIRNFRKLVMSDPAHEEYLKMHFGVSCGLAHIPADANNVEDALRCADQRMYAVKMRFKKWCRLKAALLLAE